MSEIPLRELDDHLKRLKDGSRTGPAPVYFFFGDEFLYQRAMEKLLAVLLPAGKRDVHYEPFDGALADMYAVIERLTTFSLFAGPKVIALTDARIFTGGESGVKLLEKAREETDKENLKAAARHLAAALALLDLSYEDIGRDQRRRTLKKAGELLEDDAWLDRLLEYCQENRPPIPRAADSETLLQEAILKGFPDGTILVLTAAQADKRKSLYKTIKDRGVVVDCSTPKGSRKADRDAQAALLMEYMKAVLAGHGMTAEAGVFQAVLQLTGFDLRSFTSNLDKLADYARQRRRITQADVEAVLLRTRRDEIYELTGALMERNTAEVLFYVRSLLSGGFFPLQILAAMVNQVRRLFCARGFLESPAGRGYHPDMRFDRFKEQVVPSIQDYDRQAADQASAWDEPPAGSGRRTRKGSGMPPELFILKQPQNAYPAFLLLKAAGRFTAAELARSMLTLNRADRRLKSSPVDPRLVLEEAVLAICNPAPADKGLAGRHDSGHI